MSNSRKEAAGKECVWDYPRPARLEPTTRHIRIELEGTVLAETRSAYRVIETSHPPVYYLPPDGVEMQYLVEAEGTSYCEWKGSARYYNVELGRRRIIHAAWYYTHPSPRFQELQSYIAFYPGEMDDCFVDGERVVAQPGDFYGGWITSDLVGPFKGGPGTRGW
jgi:uncharacterized protein (DUF427 family)